MQVLVTGGAGFIGSHLVERHLGRGDHVQVVDDLSTGSLDNLEAHHDDPRFRFHQADVLTWEGLDTAVAWADRVYHMAAMVGMYRVLALADEALALSYARHLGIPVTAVRLFNTVGPRQTGRYGMVPPRFVRQAVADEPITAYGDGEQSRCFCDVRDTTRALDLVTRRGRSRRRALPRPRRRLPRRRDVLARLPHPSLLRRRGVGPRDGSVRTDSGSLADAVCWAGRTTTSETTPMTRWEYKIINIRSSQYQLTPDAEPELNALGSEGWELVGITSVNFKSGATDNIAMVFKRPLD